MGFFAAGRRPSPAAAARPAAAASAGSDPQNGLSSSPSFSSSSRLPGAAFVPSNALMSAARRARRGPGSTHEQATDDDRRELPDEGKQGDGATSLHVHAVKDVVRAVGSEGSDGGRGLQSQVDPAECEVRGEAVPRAMGEGDRKERDNQSVRKRLRDERAAAPPLPLCLAPPPCLAFPPTQDIAYSLVQPSKPPASAVRAYFASLSIVGPEALLQFADGCALQFARERRRRQRRLLSLSSEELTDAAPSSPRLRVRDACSHCRGETDQASTFRFASSPREGAAPADGRSDSPPAETLGDRAHECGAPGDRTGAAEAPLLLSAARAEFVCAARFSPLAPPEKAGSSPRRGGFATGARDMTGTGGHEMQQIAETDSTAHHASFSWVDERVFLLALSLQRLPSVVWTRFSGALLAIRDTQRLSSPGASPSCDCRLRIGPRARSSPSLERLYPDPPLTASLSPLARQSSEPASAPHSGGSPAGPVGGEPLRSTTALGAEERGGTGTATRLEAGAPPEAFRSSVAVGAGVARGAATDEWAPTWTERGPFSGSLAAQPDRTAGSDGRAAQGFSDRRCMGERPGGEATACAHALFARTVYKRRLGGGARLGMQPVLTERFARMPQESLAHKNFPAAVSSSFSPSPPPAPSGGASLSSASSAAACGGTDRAAEGAFGSERERREKAARAALGEAAAPVSEGSHRRDGTEAIVAQEQGRMQRLCGKRLDTGGDGGWGRPRSRRGSFRELTFPCSRREREASGQGGVAAHFCLVATQQPECDFLYLPDVPPFDFALLDSSASSSSLTDHRGVILPSRLLLRGSAFWSRLQRPLEACSDPGHAAEQRRQAEGARLRDFLQSRRKRAERASLLSGFLSAYAQNPLLGNAHSHYEDESTSLRFLFEWAQTGNAARRAALLLSRAHAIGSPSCSPLASLSRPPVSPQRMSVTTESATAFESNGMFQAKSLPPSTSGQGTAIASAFLDTLVVHWLRCLLASATAVAALSKSPSAVPGAVAGRAAGAPHAFTSPESDQTAVPPRSMCNEAERAQAAAGLSCRPPRSPALPTSVSPSNSGSPSATYVSAHETVGRICGLAACLAGCLQLGVLPPAAATSPGSAFASCLFSLASLLTGELQPQRLATCLLATVFYELYVSSSNAALTSSRGNYSASPASAGPLPRFAVSSVSPAGSSALSASAAWGVSQVVDAEGAADVRVSQFFSQCVPALLHSCAGRRQCFLLILVLSELRDVALLFLAAVHTLLPPPRLLLPNCPSLVAPLQTPGLRGSAPHLLVESLGAILEHELVLALRGLRNSSRRMPRKRMTASAARPHAGEASKHMKHAAATTASRRQASLPASRCHSSSPSSPPSCASPTSPSSGSPSSPLDWASSPVCLLDARKAGALSAAAVASAARSLSTRVWGWWVEGVFLRTALAVSLSLPLNVPVAAVAPPSSSVSRLATPRNDPDDANALAERGRGRRRSMDNPALRPAEGTELMRAWVEVVRRVSVALIQQQRDAARAAAGRKRISRFRAELLRHMPRQFGLPPSPRLSLTPSSSPSFRSSASSGSMHASPTWRSSPSQTSPRRLLRQAGRSMLRNSEAARAATGLMDHRCRLLFFAGLSVAGHLPSIMSAVFDCHENAPVAAACGAGSKKGDERLTVEPLLSCESDSAELSPPALKFLSSLLSSFSESPWNSFASPLHSSALACSLASARDCSADSPRDGDCEAAECLQKKRWTRKRPRSAACDRLIACGVLGLLEGVSQTEVACAAAEEPAPRQESRRSARSGSEGADAAEGLDDAGPHSGTFFIFEAVLEDMLVHKCCRVLLDLLRATTPLKRAELVSLLVFLLRLLDLQIRFLARFLASSLFCASALPSARGLRPATPAVGSGAPRSSLPLRGRSVAPEGSVADAADPHEPRRHAGEGGKPPQVVGFDLESEPHDAGREPAQADVRRGDTGRLARATSEEIRGYRQPWYCRLLSEEARRDPSAGGAIFDDMPGLLSCIALLLARFLSYERQRFGATAASSPGPGEPFSAELGHVATLVRGLFYQLLRLCCSDGWRCAVSSPSPRASCTLLSCLSSRRLDAQREEEVGARERASGRSLRLRSFSSSHLTRRRTAGHDAERAKRGAETWRSIGEGACSDEDRKHRCRDAEAALEITCWLAKTFQADVLSQLIQFAHAGEGRQRLKAKAPVPAALVQKEVLKTQLITLFQRSLFVAIASALHCAARVSCGPLCAAPATQGARGVNASASEHASRDRRGTERREGCRQSARSEEISEGAAEAPSFAKKCRLSLLRLLGRARLPSAPSVADVGTQSSSVSMLPAPAGALRGGGGERRPGASRLAAGDCGLTRTSSREEEAAAVSLFGDEGGEYGLFLDSWGSPHVEGWSPHGPPAIQPFAPALKAAAAFVVREQLFLLGHSLTASSSSSASLSCSAAPSLFARLLCSVDCVDADAGRGACAPGPAPATRQPRAPAPAGADGAAEREEGDSFRVDVSRQARAATKACRQAAAQIWLLVARERVGALLGAAGAAASASSRTSAASASQLVRLPSLPTLPICSSLSSASSLAASSRSPPVSLGVHAVAEGDATASVRRRSSRDSLAENVRPRVDAAPSPGRTRSREASQGRGGEATENKASAWPPGRELRLKLLRRVHALCQEEGLLQLAACLSPWSLTAEDCKEGMEQREAHGGHDEANGDGGNQAESRDQRNAESRQGEQRGSKEKPDAREKETAAADLPQEVWLPFSVFSWEDCERAPTRRHVLELLRQLLSAMIPDSARRLAERLSLPALWTAVAAQQLFQRRTEHLCSCSVAAFSACLLGSSRLSLAKLQATQPSTEPPNRTEARALFLLQEKLAEIAASRWLERLERGSAKASATAGWSPRSSAAPRPCASAAESSIRPPLSPSSSFPSAAPVAMQTRGGEPALVFASLMGVGQACGLLLRTLQDLVSLSEAPCALIAALCDSLGGGAAPRASLSSPRDPFAAPLAAICSGSGLGDVHDELWMKQETVLRFLRRLFRATPSLLDSVDTLSALMQTFSALGESLLLVTTCVDRLSASAGEGSTTSPRARRGGDMRAALPGLCSPPTSLAFRPFFPLPTQPRVRAFAVSRAPRFLSPASSSSSFSASSSGAHVPGSSTGEGSLLLSSPPGKVRSASPSASPLHAASSLASCAPSAPDGSAKPAAASLLTGSECWRSSCERSDEESVEGRGTRHHSATGHLPQLEVGLSDGLAQALQRFLLSLFASLRMVLDRLAFVVWRTRSRGARHGDGGATISSLVLLLSFLLSAKRGMSRCRQIADLALLSGATSSRGCRLSSCASASSASWLAHAAALPPVLLVFEASTATRVPGVASGAERRPAPKSRSASPREFLKFMSPRELSPPPAPSGARFPSLSHSLRFLAGERTQAPFSVAEAREHGKPEREGCDGGIDGGLVRDAEAEKADDEPEEASFSFASSPHQTAWSSPSPPGFLSSLSPASPPPCGSCPLAPARLLVEEGDEGLSRQLLLLARQHGGKPFVVGEDERVRRAKQLFFAPCTCFRCSAASDASRVSSSQLRWQSAFASPEAMSHARDSAEARRHLAAPPMEQEGAGAETGEEGAGDFLESCQLNGGPLALVIPLPFCAAAGEPVSTRMPVPRLSTRTGKGAEEAQLEPCSQPSSSSSAFPGAAPSLHRLKNAEKAERGREEPRGAEGSDRDEHAGGLRGRATARDSWEARDGAEREGVAASLGGHQAETQKSNSEGAPRFSVFAHEESLCADAASLSVNGELAPIQSFNWGLREDATEETHSGRGPEAPAGAGGEANPSGSRVTETQGRECLGGRARRQRETGKRREEEEKTRLLDRGRDAPRPRVRKPFGFSFLPFTPPSANDHHHHPSRSPTVADAIGKRTRDVLRTDFAPRVLRIYFHGFLALPPASSSASLQTPGSPGASSPAPAHATPEPLLFSPPPAAALPPHVAAYVQEVVRSISERERRRREEARQRLDFGERFAFAFLLQLFGVSMRLESAAKKREPLDLLRLATRHKMHLQSLRETAAPANAAGAFCDAGKFEEACERQRRRSEARRGLWEWRRRSADGERGTEKTPREALVAHYYFRSQIPRKACAQVPDAADEPAEPRSATSHKWGFAGAEKVAAAARPLLRRSVSDDAVPRSLAQSVAEAWEGDFPNPHAKKASDAERRRGCRGGRGLAPDADEAKDSPPAADSDARRAAGGQAPSIGWPWVSSTLNALVDEFVFAAPPSSLPASRARTLPACGSPKHGLRPDNSWASDAPYACLAPASFSSFAFIFSRETLATICWQLLLSGVPQLAPYFGSAAPMQSASPPLAVVAPSAAVSPGLAVSRFASSSAAPLLRWGTGSALGESTASESDASGESGMDQGDWRHLGSHTSPGFAHSVSSWSPACADASPVFSFPPPPPVVAPCAAEGSGLSLFFQALLIRAVTAKRRGEREGGQGRCECEMSRDTKDSRAYVPARLPMAFASSAHAQEASHTLRLLASLLEPSAAWLAASPASDGLLVLSRDAARRAEDGGDGASTAGFARAAARAFASRQEDFSRRKEAIVEVLSLHASSLFSLFFSSASAQLEEAECDAAQATGPFQGARGGGGLSAKLAGKADVRRGSSKDMVSAEGSFGGLQDARVAFCGLGPRNAPAGVWASPGSDAEAACSHDANEADRRAAAAPGRSGSRVGQGAERHVSYSWTPGSWRDAASDELVEYKGTACSMRHPGAPGSSGGLSRCCGASRARHDGDIHRKKILDFGACAAALSPGETLLWLAAAAWTAALTTFSSCASSRISAHELMEVALAALELLRGVCALSQEPGFLSLALPVWTWFRVISQQEGFLRDVLAEPSAETGAESCGATQTCHTAQAARRHSCATHSAPASTHSLPSSLATADTPLRKPPVSDEEGGMRRADSLRATESNRSSVLLACASSQLPAASSAASSDEQSLASPRAGRAAPPRASAWSRLLRAFSLPHSSSTSSRPVSGCPSRAAETVALHAALGDDEMAFFSALLCSTWTSVVHESFAGQKDFLLDLEATESFLRAQEPATPLAEVDPAELDSSSPFNMSAYWGATAVSRAGKGAYAHRLLPLMQRVHRDTLVASFFLSRIDPLPSALLAASPPCSPARAAPFLVRETRLAAGLFALQTAERAALGAAVTSVAAAAKSTRRAQECIRSGGDASAWSTLKSSFFSLFSCRRAAAPRSRTVPSTLALPDFFLFDSASTAEASPAREVGGWNAGQIVSRVCGGGWRRARGRDAARDSTGRREGDGRTGQHTAKKRAQGTRRRSLERNAAFGQGSSSQKLLDATTGLLAQAEDAFLAASVAATACLLSSSVSLSATCVLPVHSFLASVASRAHAAPSWGVPLSEAPPQSSSSGASHSPWASELLLFLLLHTFRQPLAAPLPPPASQARVSPALLEAKVTFFFSPASSPFARSLSRTPSAGTPAPPHRAPSSPPAISPLRAKAEEGRAGEGGDAAAAGRLGFAARLSKSAREIDRDKVRAAEDKEKLSVDAAQDTRAKAEAAETPRPPWRPKVPVCFPDKAFASPPVGSLSSLLLLPLLPPAVASSHPHVLLAPPRSGLRKPRKLPKSTSLLAPDYARSPLSLDRRERLLGRARRSEAEADRGQSLLGLRADIQPFGRRRRSTKEETRGGVGAPKSPRGATCRFSCFSAFGNASSSLFLAPSFILESLSCGQASAAGACLSAALAVLSAEGLPPGDDGSESEEESRRRRGPRDRAVGARDEAWSWDEVEEADWQVDSGAGRRTFFNCSCGCLVCCFLRARQASACAGVGSLLAFFRRPTHELYLTSCACPLHLAAAPSLLSPALAADGASCAPPDRAEAKRTESEGAQGHPNERERQHGHAAPGDGAAAVCRGLPLSRFSSRSSSCSVPSLRLPPSADAPERLIALAKRCSRAREDEETLARKNFLLLSESLLVLFGGSPRSGAAASLLSRGRVRKRGEEPRLAKSGAKATTDTAMVKRIKASTRDAAAKQRPAEECGLSLPRCDGPWPRGDAFFFEESSDDERGSLTRDCRAWGSEREGPSAFSAEAVLDSNNRHAYAAPPHLASCLTFLPEWRIAFAMFTGASLSSSFTLFSRLEASAMRAPTGSADAHACPHLLSAFSFTAHQGDGDAHAATLLRLGSSVAAPSRCSAAASGGRARCREAAAASLNSEAPLCLIRLFLCDEVERVRAWAGMRRQGAAVPKGTGLSPAAASENARHSGAGDRAGLCDASESYSWGNGARRRRRQAARNAEASPRNPSAHPRQTDAEENSRDSPRAQEGDSKQDASSEASAQLGGRRLDATRRKAAVWRAMGKGACGAKRVVFLRQRHKKTRAMQAMSGAASRMTDLDTRMSCRSIFSRFPLIRRLCRWISPARSSAASVALLSSSLRASALRDGGNGIQQASARRERETATRGEPAKAGIERGRRRGRRSGAGRGSVRDTSNVRLRGNLPSSRFSLDSLFHGADLALVAAAVQRFRWPPEVLRESSSLRLWLEKREGRSSLLEICVEFPRSDRSSSESVFRFLLHYMGFFSSPPTASSPASEVASLSFFLPPAASSTPSASSPPLRASAPSTLASRLGTLCPFAGAFSWGAKRCRGEAALPAFLPASSANLLIYSFRFPLCFVLQFLAPAASVGLALAIARRIRESKTTSSGAAELLVPCLPLHASPRIAARRRERRLCGKSHAEHLQLRCAADAPPASGRLQPLFAGCERGGERVAGVAETSGDAGLALRRRDRLRCVSILFYRRRAAETCNARGREMLAQRRRRRLKERRDASSSPAAPFSSPSSLLSAGIFITMLRACAVRSLAACPPSLRGRLILPQLIQLMRVDVGRVVEALLLHQATCAQEESEAAALPEMFQAATEAAPDPSDRLARKCSRLQAALLLALPPERREVLRRQYAFWDALAALSGKARKVLPANERGAFLQSEIARLVSQVDLRDMTMPLDPSRLLTRVLSDSVTPLQSAAKVPYALTFETRSAAAAGVSSPRGREEETGEVSEVLSMVTCIFKMHDDVRQDQLALQIIQLAASAFHRVGVDVWLRPYKVVSMRVASPPLAAGAPACPPAAAAPQSPPPPDDPPASPPASAPRLSGLASLFAATAPPPQRTVCSSSASSACSLYSSSSICSSLPLALAASPQGMRPSPHPRAAGAMGADGEDAPETPAAREGLRASLLASRAAEAELGDSLHAANKERSRVPQLASRLAAAGAAKPAGGSAACGEVKREKTRRPDSVATAEAPISALGGLIELIPNTISRHHVGKKLNCSLPEFFAVTFNAVAAENAKAEPHRVFSRHAEREGKRNDKDATRTLCGAQRGRAEGEVRGRSSRALNSVAAIEEGSEQERDGREEIPAKRSSLSPAKCADTRAQGCQRKFESGAPRAEAADLQAAGKRKLFFPSIFVSSSPASSASSEAGRGAGAERRPVSESKANAERRRGKGSEGGAVAERREGRRPSASIDESAEPASRLHAPEELAPQSVWGRGETGPEPGRGRAGSSRLPASATSSQPRSVQRRLGSRDRTRADSGARVEKERDAAGLLRGNAEREEEDSLLTLSLLRARQPEEKRSLLYDLAVQNFIKSLAGYAVLSYILQIKDRHNGNLLISKQSGRVIHIDFGFVFDISPGHDLQFEKAPFKLTTEMVQLMGGHSRTEAFRFFTDLCVQGYLALREQADSIVTLVQAMLHSGLPCFKRQSLENLKWRFQLEASPEQAAAFMEARVMDAYDNFTTKAYDVVQHLQQGIDY
ncbi:hypothetical protein BESB_058370 [Besnoitia besnoiti]|uniref:PI3K/PI4K catalytic domain-containing protein n=1 Tax=Besnoitia besnoiti TaxID=94643 RepID=A0A2A9MHR4_BESBE|nr:hypothetical protein BESB_058370 [Besnoitia besnoiti]PFH34950.1 hypothetical protein BESB_058370 [Besnoitia besnoiti]